MSMRGKAMRRGALALLLAATCLTAMPALADGRHGRDRHDGGRHWDRGHHGKHWDRGRHRGWDRHDRRPVIVVPAYRYHYRPHYRYVPPPPRRGGVYLYFDLSSFLGAPVGDTLRWQDDRQAGTMVTTAAYDTTDGRYCREYQKTVTIAGRLEEVWGTACLQPDGDWEIISERN